MRREHVTYVPGVAGGVARCIAPTETGLEALLEARTSYEQGLRDVVGDWPQESQRVNNSGLVAVVAEEAHHPRRKGRKHNG